MKKNTTLALLLFMAQYCLCQVGVGTTSPTSELEISTVPDGIPALELNPQTSPVGTAAGQLSVIDNILYLYDNVRSKWLSIESYALQFGYGGNTDGDVLWFGGDVGDPDSGAKMPFNGTIVGISATSSGGNTGKLVYLVSNGFLVPPDTDPNLSGDFNLSSGQYINNSYNLDFSAGDVLTIFVSSSGSFVVDPTVILWVKRRP